MKERTGGAFAPAQQTGEGDHFGNSLNQMLAAWKNTAAPVVFAVPVTESPRPVDIEAVLKAMEVMPVATEAVEEASALARTEEPQEALQPESKAPARRGSIARSVLNVFVGVSVDPEAEAGFSVVFGGTNADLRPNTSATKADVTSEERPTGMGATTVAPATARLQTVTG